MTDCPASDDFFDGSVSEKDEIRCLLVLLLWGIYDRHTILRSTLLDQPRLLFISLSIPNRLGPHSGSCTLERLQRDAELGKESAWLRLLATQHMAAATTRRREWSDREDPLTPTCFAIILMTTANATQMFSTMNIIHCAAARGYAGNGWDSTVGLPTQHPRAQSSSHHQGNLGLRR